MKEVPWGLGTRHSCRYEYIASPELLTKTLGGRMTITVYRDGTEIPWSIGWWELANIRDFSFES
jgi:hypothetical protein